VAHLSGSQDTRATARPFREKLEAVSDLVRCFLAVGVLAIGLSTCGGAEHGPTVAVVSVCQGALAATNPSEMAFMQAAEVKRAEASGGAAFARVVKTWLATVEPEARASAANAVVKECDRIGGFPSG